MSYRHEINSSRRAAATADARVVAREAGVIPVRIDTFLRLVDVADGPDEATVRERVRAALADAPEFDARKLPLGPPPPPQPRDAAPDAVPDALAGMRQSLGLSAPADPPSAPASTLQAETDELAAQMKRSLGL